MAITVNTKRELGRVCDEFKTQADDLNKAIVFLGKLKDVIQARLDRKKDALDEIQDKIRLIKADAGIK